jgi:multiple sugar transport system permease protein
MKLTRTNLNNGVNSFFVTALAVAILALFLMPFLYMVLTSLKTTEQISIIGGPIWPAAPATMEFNGKKIEMYTVPLSACAGQDPATTDTKDLGIVTKGRQTSTFVDPDNVQAGEITCTLAWGTLDRPWKFSPTWSNYSEVWTSINFPRLVWNTFYYAIMSGIGTVISCTLVAYGFARFRFPGRDFLFVVLISTIFLPGFVTVIPTYTFFQSIGWVGTWLPLIVPAFFANAYNVFLLRQYFLTLPRELDEAAMMDGAGPFRVLWSVILPQSYPALMAVIVFHIVYSWNDYFGPLIYLSTARENWPISIALSTFNGIYGSKPQLIQAGSLMALLAPLLLFRFAQRFFIQGSVSTGVDK